MPGYIVIADTIKEKARTTLRYLKEKREAVLVMMTGDTEKASLPVAKELKMDYAYTDLMPTDKMEQLEEFMELQDGMERVVCVGMESMMRRCLHEQMWVLLWERWDLRQL